MLTKLQDYEFNEFAKSHPLNTFFQSSYWGDLKESNGWKKHIVGIKENGEVKGASLILSKKIPFINKNMFYAPRGFLIDYNNLSLLKEFNEEVIKYIKKEKGIFLKINPYITYQQYSSDGEKIDIKNEDIISNLKELGYEHNGFTLSYGSDLEPRWLSVLDLKGKTEEDILNNMKGKTRWGVLNCQKRGLRLIELDRERIVEFKSLMEHTSERRGFLDRPLSYYQKMYDCFKKDNGIKIMVVELDVKDNLKSLEKQKEELLIKIININNKSNNSKNKRILNELKQELYDINKKIMEAKDLISNEGEKILIAGGLFMTFGTQVIYLFGGSYRKYMKYNGQYFLNYEMIKYALNNGYKKYNFFGIDGTFDKDKDTYGLYSFKKGFGSEIEELIGEFNYIVDKNAYLLYQLSFDIYRRFKRKLKKK